MKALVTGAAGFIGSNLVRRLVAEGHDVIAVDDLSYGLERNLGGHPLIQADIAWDDLRQLMTGVDAVFHLAALSDIPACEANPARTCEVNVLGTARVFEAALGAKVPRVIFAESAAIYEGTTIRPTPESEFAPRSHYGVSKACNHLQAVPFRGKGTSYTGLRFLGVYGPGQNYRRANPQVQAAVILKLLRDESPILYEGDETKSRDFIHVDDIVEFLLIAAGHPRAIDETFNVGAGVVTTIYEVVKACIRASGKEIAPRLLPKLPPGPQSLESVLCDNRKARSLGWTPKVGLTEGLQSQWDYMVSELPYLQP